MKNPRHTFWGNLIINTSCDDVTVTSVINIKYSGTAIDSILQGTVVIRFLWPKRLSTNAIHTDIHPMYRHKCFTRPAIHALCTKFAHGCV